MRQRAGRMWRSPPVLWAAVAVMAIVAVCGAIVALPGGGKSSGAAAPAAAVRSVQSRVQGCRVPAGDQRVPLDPPAAHWDKIGDYQAPGSTLVGPGVIDGHVRRCYSHSPTGAVFAAYGFSALAATYHSDTAMLRELIAEGAAREAGLRRGSPPPPTDVDVEPIGFRVMDYAPTAATIVVGYRVAPKPSAEMDLGQTGSRLVGIQYRTRWERGDWKIVVEPGDDGFAAEPLDSIAGLVMFGAPS